MAEINVSKPGWQNSLRKVFKDFQKTEMSDIIYNELDSFCRALLALVVGNRLHNKEAHQFTGNLINSIVVILFDRNTGVKSDYYAYDDLKAPIRKEMSAVTSRGTRRKNAVHFRPADWQGTIDSMYKPEVATDESMGPQDARAFASSWSPSTGKAFEICVAYTSEYAEWVEQQRQTTGYVVSFNSTRKELVHMGFKKIA